MTTAEDWSSDAVDHFQFLREDVFAEDGSYEECIARDSYPAAFPPSSKSGTRQQRTSHHGIPSVTPTAVIRETIIDNVFDRIWAEAVPALLELLLLCMRTARKANSARGTASYSHEGASHIADASLSQAAMKTAISVMALPATQSSADMGTLKELMTIRSVALQHRAPSVTSNIFRYDDPTADSELPQSSDFNRRPFTSQTLCGSLAIDARPLPRPLSVRNASDHNLYERMLASKTPKRHITRLQPIHHIGDKSKNSTTEQVARDVSQEILRGTRLQSTADHRYAIGSDPFSLPWRPRAGQLPPIDIYDSAEMAELTLEDSRKSPRGKKNGSSVRVSSAVLSDETRRLQRDRVVIQTSDSRPNTTHTVRSEITLNAAKRLVSQSSFTSQGKQSSSNSQINFSSKSHGSGKLLTSSMVAEAAAVAHHRDMTIEEETADELDDFVLWGRGPPLIAHQPARSKGRTPWAAAPTR